MANTTTQTRPAKSNGASTTSSADINRRDLDRQVRQLNSQLTTLHRQLGAAPCMLPIYRAAGELANMLGLDANAGFGAAG